MSHSRHSELIGDFGEGVGAVDGGSDDDSGGVGNGNALDDGGPDGREVRTALLTLGVPEDDGGRAEGGVDLADEGKTAVGGVELDAVWAHPVEARRSGEEEPSKGASCAVAGATMMKSGTPKPRQRSVGAR